MFPKCAILCQVMHARFRSSGPGGTWYTALLPVILCLSGCHDADHAGDVLSRYADRVTNVLGTEFVPPSPDWEQLAPPRRRERLQPVADIRVGMLDVLDLVHCDLLHEVGQRNSSLGRVQRPSVRLHHEVRMLNGLRRCLAAPAGADPAFRDWLRDLVRQKERAQAAVYRNAVYGDTEFETMFSRAGGVLRISRLEAAAASTQALHELRGLLAGALTGGTLDHAALEAQLDRMQGGAAGGVVLAQMHAATLWLERLTASMESGEPQRMCPRGHATRRARILENVFRTFYVGEVQPWLARLDREGQQWLAAFRDLEAVLPGSPPPPLRDFLSRTTHPEHPGGVRARFRHVVPAHARAWQRWLSACGLMPSR